MQVISTPILLVTGKRKNNMAETNVYWNARNLGSRFNFGFGNHHYILISIGDNGLQTSITHQTTNGFKFLTLGAFNIDGNMVFQANNESDVVSAKEVFGEYGGNWFDWGTQKHKVNPPFGDGKQFAEYCIKLALNYERNTKTNPLPYSLVDENCAAWVNTLFKAANVSRAERRRIGEFWGVDWGEEDKIPIRLFN